MKWFKRIKTNAEFTVKPSTLAQYANPGKLSDKLDSLMRDQSPGGIVDAHYLRDPWRLWVLFDTDKISSTQLEEWLRKESLI